MVELLIQSGHLALDPAIGGIDILEIKLGNHVPLIFGPSRRWLGCKFRDIILEGKPFGLAHRESPRIQADVLIAGILRGMLVWIAPAQLHGSVGANACPAQVVLENLGSDRHAIDVDLDARGATRAVTGEENVLPRIIERQRLKSSHTDGYITYVLFGRFAGLRLFRPRFRCLFGFCFLLAVFLSLY